MIFFLPLHIPLTRYNYTQQCQTRWSCFHGWLKKNMMQEQWESPSSAQTMTTWTPFMPVARRRKTILKRNLNLSFKYSCFLIHWTTAYMRSGYSVFTARLPHWIILSLLFMNCIYSAVLLCNKYQIEIDVCDCECVHVCCVTSHGIASFMMCSLFYWLFSLYVFILYFNVFLYSDWSQRSV